MESEGDRQSKINVAEGDKAQVILASEAAQQDAVNRAHGEASAILARAEATAKGLKNVSEAITCALCICAFCNRPLPKLNLLLCCC